MQTPTKKLIKGIYLYLVSFVTLMMIIIPSVSLLNQILKDYIFKEANQYPYDYPISTICPTASEKNINSTSPKQIEDCDKMQMRTKEQEKNRIKSDRHNTYAENISFLIISIPLFMIH